MRRSSHRLRDVAVTVVMAVGLVFPLWPHQAAADHQCAPYGRTPVVVRGTASVGWSISPPPPSWEYRIAPAGTRAWVVVASGSGGQPYQTTWNTLAFPNGVYDVYLSSLYGSTTHHWCYSAYLQIANLPTAPSPVSVSPTRNVQDVFDASWGASTASSGISHYEYAIDCNTSRLGTTAAQGVRLIGQAAVRGTTHYLCVRAVDRTGVRGPFAYSASFTYTFLSPNIGPLTGPDPTVVGAGYAIGTTLTDPSGRPLAGKRVQFGASWGPSGWATTDAQGRAALTLPGAVRPGGYTIQAILYSDGTYATASISRRITVAADTVAPTAPANVTVIPATSTTNAFRATWSASTDPVPGSGVSYYEWRVDGGPITRALATSTASFGAPGGVGRHTFEVRAVDFAGNRSAFASATFELTPAATTLTFTEVPASVTRCSSVDLGARLTLGSTPLLGRAVSLRIGGSGATAMTNVAGIASASIPFEGAPGRYAVIASYGGDPGLPASQATAMIQVTGDASTSCRPSGGGPPPDGGPPPGGGTGGGQGGSGRGGLSVDIPAR